MAPKQQKETPVSAPTCRAANTTARSGSVKQTVRPITCKKRKRREDTFFPQGFPRRQLAGRVTIWDPKKDWTFLEAPVQKAAPATTAAPSKKKAAPKPPSSRRPLLTQTSVASKRPLRTHTSAASRKPLLTPTSVASRMPLRTQTSMPPAKKKRAASKEVWRGYPDDDIGSPWPAGWIKSIMQSGSNNERHDKYWYDPHGHKFRSLAQVKRHLKADKEDCREEIHSDKSPTAGWKNILGDLHKKMEELEETRAANLKAVFADLAKQAECPQDVNESLRQVDKFSEAESIRIKQLQTVVSDCKRHIQLELPAAFPTLAMETSESEGRKQKKKQDEAMTGRNNEDECFVVEEMLAVRRCPTNKNRWEALLKWEGYPEEHNLWLTKQAFEHSDGLLKDFEQMKKAFIIKEKRDTSLPFRVADAQELSFQSVGGLPLGRIVLDRPGSTPKRKKTILRELFGNRILEIDVPLPCLSSQEMNLPKRLSLDGYTFDMFVPKIHDKKSQFSSGDGRPSKFGEPKMATYYYIAVAGKGIPEISLQTELEKTGDFRRLPSCGKAMSRLELACSPAEYIRYKNLTEDDFELVDEVSHEGCGFIPRKYIEQFLGTNAVGKRTFALQVRVVAPKLGWFKGVLFEKPGIDKIQLPASMKKVDESNCANAGHGACVAITHKFPSENNMKMEKLWTDGSTSDFFQKRMTDMIQLLLCSLGVDKEELASYVKHCSKEAGPHRRHAFLVGLADPTDSIPPGHIVLTGSQNNHQLSKRVFVTRCPCNEVTDGRTIKLVTKKPEKMTEENWKWLTEEMSFGGIVFGNPRKGAPPMCQNISKGDLDGDLYFTCWEPTIVDSVKNVRFDMRAKSNPKKKSTATTSPLHENWFKDTQAYMGNLSFLGHMNIVTGMLYNRWKQTVQEKGLRDRDSLAFGRAYQESLDVLKHGGKIYLPPRLLDTLLNKNKKILEIFFTSERGER